MIFLSAYTVKQGGLIYYLSSITMSQTSINESVMSSKTYSLTLRTSAPDTSTALRIIRENVLRLTGKGSEEMISPLSGNAVHYIDPFSVHEVDQRKRKWDVVERLIRLEKENKGLQSVWSSYLMACRYFHPF